MTQDEHSSATARDRQALQAIFALDADFDDATYGTWQDVPVLLGGRHSHYVGPPSEHFVDNWHKFRFEE